MTSDLSRYNSLSRSVRGRTAVITGAASGMGRALAQLMAADGASVGLIDRPGTDLEPLRAELQAIADQCPDGGGTVAPAHADVGDRSQVEQAIGAIRSELGPIDILVNNAGVSLPAPIASEGYDEAWATSLAVELGRRGVTVNAVAPGPINTGMTSGIADEHKERFARRNVPVGRYGEPEEVAHAVLSLVLPCASYINGAVLVVDGGMTIQNV